jgi:hypothetical protein
MCRCCRASLSAGVIGTLYAQNERTMGKLSSKLLDVHRRNLVLVDQFDFGSCRPNVNYSFQTQAYITSMMKQTCVRYTTTILNFNVKLFLCAEYLTKCKEPSFLNLRSVRNIQPEDREVVIEVRLRLRPSELEGQ